MAEGLDLTFKDFTANKSFNDAAEFYKHLSSTGRRPVRGHFKCRMCNKILEDWSGQAAVNDETGIANVVCEDCRKHLAAEVSA